MKKTHILLLFWLSLLSVLAVAAQGNAGIPNTQIYFSNQETQVHDLVATLHFMDICPSGGCEYSLESGKNLYIQDVDSSKNYTYEVSIASTSHPEINGVITSGAINGGQCFRITGVFIDARPIGIDYDDVCPSSTPISKALEDKVATSFE